MHVILVVEDDDAIRSNLARVLTLEGFEAVAAADGRSGLAHASARRPDLIISNVNMPGMDGFELLAAVRADPTLATTPFMLLTAPTTTCPSLSRAPSCLKRSTRSCSPSWPR